ncbi:phenylacetate--CoA ligase family protein [Denitrobaculum tricleocarpae]|uniref:Phenylacetate--CoA ligase n=1 Tax=Denitrobaculum tricleocarpae TaxID=2591009 RepID=A0A545TR06_9PROT|nr:AMP-binding protein [Denitrobaculum tricleocarpae]TQV79655.1 phenylacetate--CoA ligase [Denitrobaculum tricleocarpae]
MTASGSFFDELETRSADARQAALSNTLPAQIGLAREKSAAYAELLSDVAAQDVVDMEALSHLPVTRKSALIELQKDKPPFGGFPAVGPGAMAHIFASPGPIYEFETARHDFWGMARAFHAAGFRPGDVVHNSFAYHLTPGGWIFDGGARALGCAVIPAGIGNTEMQAETIAHLRPSGFGGTPDYLKVILDKAQEMGADCSSITRALVSGGALFPSLRQEYAERGVAVQQCYATADLGLISYESRTDDGALVEGMLVSESVLLEIVRPGTGDPVPEGEVGEVVVTTFNPDYPLVRFATGDLSAILPGASPCGRTNGRIKGWMGRADQTAKIKGMFVHPEQLDRVVKAHPELLRARIVVTREDESDVMSVLCESETRDENLAGAIADSVQSFCKLRGKIVLQAPGELPNDGKVIDDQRDFEGAG